MSDIERWLEARELGHFTEMFRNEQIEISDLPDLTDEDLRELGLPMGPRKRLLRAIRSLREEAETGPEEAGVAQATLAPTGEAERRQLTVMFADLVGSTALAERLDPEDLREVNRLYQDAAKDAIELFGGFVARYMGDGVLAYFGFPTSHEDDSERAIRAGLALIQNVQALDSNVELSVRIGVATGQVVVGDLIGEGASQESAVVGETPNLAARFQALAEPNSIVVGERTKTLVGGAFDFERLPTQSIRGFSERITPYCVKRERMGQSRFEARTGRDLTPFVGREDEVDLLVRRWQRVLEGYGTAALIIGEPGIGKSRLVEQIRSEVIGANPTSLLFQCSSHNRNTALFPILTYLETVLTAHAVGSAIEFESVRAFFGTGSSDTQWLPFLLAHALGVEGVGPEPEALAALDPDARRRHLMTGLTEYLVHQSEQAPLFCVLEDLHWADPTTLELLSQFVEQIAERPILLLATTRSGFSASWSDLPHCRMLSLPRLEGDAAIKLASSITNLDAELVETITDRAGGNPLFLEELVHAVTNAGDRSPEESSIPETLQDSLMARLDATGTGRSVAQCASVLGRDFSASSVTAIWDGNAAALASGLRSVVETGLLLERTNRAGIAEYTFKHALVRDAAYGTLLRERRRRLHRAAAEHLIALREANPRAATYELIAHHLSESAELLGALRYWVLAGESASVTSSYRECEAHLRRAIDAIHAVEAPSEFQTQELELLVLLGPALMALYGYSADAVGDVYERARTISESTQGKPHLTPILNGLRLHRICRSGVTLGIEPAQALLAHADVLDDNASRIEGCKALGSTLLWTGQFTKARDLLADGIALYDMADDMDVMRVDSDSGMTCHSFMSVVEWACGNLERSIYHSDLAMKIASVSDRSFGIGECLSFRSMVLHLHRNHDSAMHTAREARQFADEHNYVLWKAMSTIYLGASLVAQGTLQAGLRHLEDAQRLLLDMGYVLWQPIYLTEIGRAFAQLGEHETAMASFEDALAVSRRTEESFWRPEIHRNTGLLLLRTGEINAAVDELRRSLDWAVRTENRMGALRAGTSLARALHERRDSDEARRILAPIIGSVREPLENIDFQAATLLLSELPP